MNLPSEPMFVSPYKDEAGGVDFLGLRQVNLNLIDQFLPGINNVTYSLRPYAVMAWLSWAFKEAAAASGITEPKLSQFEQFREKVEVLFNWSHQLNNAGIGMAGNAQIKPNNGDGEVSLKFLDWKRNVSWFDAVNYGPSSKIDNGLGFLIQVRPGIYATTPLGESLAKGLDASLRKSDSYAKLNSLNQLVASEEDANNLFMMWKIDTPTPQESEVYCRALYDANSINESTRLGHRSATIKLIISAFKSLNKPVSTEELRKFLVYTNYPFSNQEKCEEPLAEMHSLWRVLQVRQAHRLAFEVFFGWVESRVMEFGRTDSAEIIADFVKVLLGRNQLSQIDSWVIDKISEFEKARNEIGSIFIRSGKNPELDIFEQINLILEEVKSDRDASVIRAMEILLLCAVISDELHEDKRALPQIREGGSTRISLDCWAKFVQSNKSMPIQAFVSKLVENFLLSQHFGVAAARYTEGKQRLRLTIEERGLVSMLKNTNEIWKPNIASDRLDTMLSLMKDAGLLITSDVDGKHKYCLAI